MKQQFRSRDELMKDLRKHHFAMGNDATNDAKSEYINEYTQHPNISQHNMGDKLGLKHSHFNVGDDDPKRYYQSIYKRDHIEFKDIAVAKLEESLKKDLRRHHWELGNEPTTKSSEAKEHFVPLVLPQGTRAELDAVKKRNKQENLHFADNANYFSSVYKEHHNKNLDQYKQQSGSNKEAIQKQLQELRSSHIPFGFSQNDFGTSNKNAFSNKNTNYERVGPSIDLMETHFFPGDDMQPSESMYKHFHKEHPIDKVTLNEDLLKDLRGKTRQEILWLAHHFKYGDATTNYESEHIAGFKEYPEEAFPKKGDNPLLQQNHFRLGDDKPIMQSFYKSEHIEIPVSQIKKESHAKRDRSSNIVLGYNNEVLKSEAASTFIKFGGSNTAKLEEGLKKDLRKSHFKFDDPITYESYSHSTHKNLLEESNKINTRGVFKELAKDLRKNHFEYGNDPFNFKTTNRDGFKGFKGNPSVLQKELAEDLKKNHFEYGTDNKLVTESIYKKEFDWKTPDENL